MSIAKPQPCYLREDNNGNELPDLTFSFMTGYGGLCHPNLLPSPWPLTKGYHRFKMEDKYLPEKLAWKTLRHIFISKKIPEADAGPQPSEQRLHR
ncbi:unnamed protein product [Tilletia caries]|uniref:Uncharacterized protein n=1 Tax=Tilletia caries TaxID=13290 RepID=A0ABN7IRV5_9BASI|nr:unnamed protein product [Tilletia caries]